MPEIPQNKSLHNSLFPDIFTLRKWDFALLERYKPVFAKSDKTCHLCALGPCKPYRESRGKCGIDETGFKARAILLDAVIGASGHASHAARLIEDLIVKYAKDCPVDAGPHTAMPTPITTLITGCKPKNIGELKDIIAYIEGQLTHLLSSVNFGTEASPEDFVSKALHAGMLDNLAMEIADIAQISAMNMPKGESNSPIVAIGLETVDTSKPVLLIIGHNSTVAHEIMHLLEQKNLKKSIEVCGLCCAASDGARHSHGFTPLEGSDLHGTSGMGSLVHSTKRPLTGFKIIGNQASQLEVIRSGIADVVILDTQCIRADALLEARKVGSIVIATTQETALGLKDLTEMQSDEVVEYVLENGEGIVLDKKAAAEMALSLGVRSQESGVRRKKQGSTHPTSGLLRIGRGLIRDSEIRGVAPCIIMGEIPGIIGIFGCPEKESQEPRVRSQESETKNLVEEFLKRGYIVSTGGCASMDAAREEVRSQESGVRREKQGGLFKNNPDFFDSGNLTNLGSCVSASHLIGACIKIAHIMCHRKLENNYQEIADYIINRVGAVVILWGAFTQKAFSSALGMARLGIPVIFGPKFKNYGLHLLGRNGEWLVRDARLGDMVSTGPAPQNLLCFAETIEEALPLAAKLCMRPNDTSDGRKIKLKSYIELYKKDKKHLPPDINLFIRTHYDMPEEAEDEIQRILKTKDWKPAFIPDPTML